jgi:hypothetical protein
MITFRWICLGALLALLFLTWGWAGIFLGVPLILLIMLFVARRMVDREDEAAIRRVQGRGL